MLVIQDNAEGVYNLYTKPILLQKKNQANKACLSDHMYRLCYSTMLCERTREVVSRVWTYSLDQPCHLRLTAGDGPSGYG